MEAKTASMAADVSYSGVVAPRVEAALGFRVAGRIVARPVDVGATVKSGQVLATLDPTPFKLAIDEAAGALSEAQAAAAEAERDLKRNRALTERGVVAKASVDGLRAAAEAARARVVQARSRLKIAESDAGFASLVAPADGVVTAVEAEVGQFVPPGQTAFKVARLDQMEITLDVPETRIGAIRQGAAARVTLVADPDAVLAGLVREVSPSADAASRTFRVKLTLTDSGRARLGMTAVAVFSSESQAAIELPLSSLTQSGAKPAVWVVADGTRLELRPVEIGAMGADHVSITAGLKAGEQVVTAGVHRLDAGQAVHIWDGALP